MIQWFKNRIVDKSQNSTGIFLQDHMIIIELMLKNELYFLLTCYHVQVSFIAWCLWLSIWVFPTQSNFISKFNFKIQWTININKLFFISIDSTLSCLFSNNIRLICGIRSSTLHHFNVFSNAEWSLVTDKLFNITQHPFFNVHLNGKKFIT